MILDSRIGALDRTLGFLFGLARGPPDRGRRLHVFQLAGSRQAAAGLGDGGKIPVVLQGTGDWLMSLLPDDPENTILKRFKKNKPDDEQTDTDPAARRLVMAIANRPATA